MKKPRLSIRISLVGQDLLRQVAGALGVTMTSAVELLVREKAAMLGLKPRPPAGTEEDEQPS